MLPSSLLLLVLLVGSALAARSDTDRWSEFKAVFGRSYSSAEHEAYRFGVFTSNLRAAEALQALDTHASYGVTKFMDLTDTEFLATFASQRRQDSGAVLPFFSPVAGKRSANGTNWVEKGLVGSVKSQGHCGSCWAFAGAASLEVCMASHTGRAVDLSAAQVLDCYPHSQFGIGCIGANEHEALQWASESLDLASEKDYPYPGWKHSCHEAPVALPKGTCKFRLVQEGEDALAEALAYGAVVVSIDGVPLKFYKGGVISGITCKLFRWWNHAVVVVADNTDDGSSFMLKNSWGPDWGENGYFRLAKGLNCLRLGLNSSIAF